MTTMLKLYDYELSGNCYKVRLLLSMLGLEYASEIVEFYPGREHKQAEFLRLNPLGQLPLLADCDYLLPDAQAILVYLAVRYDASGNWCPQRDAAALGQIARWLSFADALTQSLGAARLQQGFGYELDLEACQSAGHQLLRVIDEHLWFAQAQRQSWLLPGAHPSIADVACFPYIILSEEGGIERQDYPAIRLWCDQVKRIPGFITMPGVFPAGRGLEG